jgi:gliding motility-associated-like protein
VVGICVEEIRGGVVINRSIRDFQFNVENCTIPSAAPLVVTDNTNTSAIKVNDTTFSNCQGAVVRFDNEVTQSGVTYFWDFGVPSRTDDTSNLKNPTFAYPDTGVYYATLIINKGRPCNDTSRIKIIYYPGLVPNFTYVPRCQNQSIQFTDSSTSPYNDVNNWKWVLSAGDTSLVKNPTKIFSTPGTYNVQLTATTAKGCVGKVTKQVVVNPKPTANFTSANLCYKRGTLFTDASTGTISGYSWNFGDGNTDTLKNPTHVFNQFDSFNVQHVVTSPFGCKDTIIKKIKMDDTVRLSYTTTPANLCEKAPVTFTNTSTGGNPTAFQWIINNGTPTNGNTATATFTASGTFPLQLISTNRCGKDTLNSTVKINANPSVNLGTDVTVCNKSTKTLTAAGAFDSIRWSTAENTTAISVDGTKSPIYISVYKNGCLGKDTVLVKKQTITPNFSNTYLCLNKAVTFVNTSTVNSGTLVQYDWKYGDGQTDLNTQNPTHTFSPFANYSVQLIATSDIGCKDTVTKIIPMDTVQQVDFKSTELITCQRNQVTFQNLTTGGVNNAYTWITDNGTYTTKDLSHAFSGTGTYPVKLIVKNRCYADSITRSYVIRPRPNVYIGRDTVLCKNQRVTFTVNPSLYDSIRWSNGSTAANLIDGGTFNPLKIFVYVDGCRAEDTVNVNAQKMTLNFTNGFVCFNKELTFSNTSSINFGSIANYDWNFGDNTTSGIKSPTHTYSVFGPKNVTLITKSNAGCFDTLSKALLMDDSVSLAINPIPTDVCFGKTSQYANLSFGGLNTQYVWTLNNSNPQTKDTATYSYFTAGTQILKLTATNRCGADSIKYGFEVKPLPRINLGDDIIMCPGEQRILSIKTPADSVFWSTGENNDSITINGTVSPINVEVYKDGCLQRDSILISTNCDIFIPSAFSPNNDGINDLLNMMNKSVKTYNLKIFDRWGALMFETDDFANSWDGKYKGAECQVDNYIYVVTGVKYNDEPFYIKGTITLLR